MADAADADRRALSQSRNRRHGSQLAARSSSDRARRRHCPPANYLSAGQIDLLGSPLLRESVRADRIKPRLLGDFGTVPGLNLVYAHLYRVILERDLQALYIAGPGHGARAW